MPKDFPRATPRPVAKGSPERSLGEGPSPYSHTPVDATPSVGGETILPPLLKKVLKPTPAPVRRAGLRNPRATK